MSRLLIAESAGVESMCGTCLSKRSFMNRLIRNADFVARANHTNYDLASTLFSSTDIFRL